MSASIREVRLTDQYRDLLRRVTTLERTPRRSLHRFQAATVDANETVGGTSYGDLTTVGPTVTVDVTSGRLLVFMFADFTGIEIFARCFMSFRAIGPQTIEPDDDTAIVAAAALGVRAGSVALHANLTPGEYVITAKYKASFISLGGDSISRRTLIAIPL